MPSVLIVEDEAAIRETLGLVLEDEGYDVLQAANGEQALALLGPSAPPMVVLLDRMMPILTGDYLLMTLAASPALRNHHAFVLITAAGAPSSELVRHAMEKLDVTFVPKPFQLEQLLPLVKRLALQLDDLTRSDQADNA